MKTAGVDSSIFRFKGPARVFFSQEAACDGILGGAAQAETAETNPGARPSCLSALTFWIVRVILMV